MNTRRITLIVAVVLALGTGVLTLRYLVSINKSAATQQVQLQPVIVASRDIPARTTISADMLTKVTRAASDVQPGAFSDPKQAEGDIALVSIPQNSALTATTVGQPAEAGLTARLQPGMRAVSIPVDHVKDVSNLVQPGDRVDVMAAVSKGAGVPPKTFTIIRGALVLAINSQLEAAGASPSPDSGGASTITLGVTPDQADLLTVADLNTTLRLALRSPKEPVRSLPSERLVFADLGSVPQAPGPVTAGSRNVPPPILPYPVPRASGQSFGGVTVIDGDRVTGGRN